RLGPFLAGQAPRRDAHPRHRLRPPPGAHRAVRDQRRRRRPRSRALHRPAGRHRVGEGHCARAARADDRRHEPRPRRLPGPVLAPAHRRRHRRPARGALLRVLPPGPGGCAAPLRARARLARRPRVGDHRPGRGVPPRRRRGAALRGDVLGAQQGRPRRAGPRVSARHLARAARPRPGPPRGLGGPVGSRAALPAGARRRDQLVDEGLRMKLSRDLTTAATLPTVRIVPMQRRHLRAVLEIDRQVYPRPWSLSLYQGELAMPANRRVYLVARIGRRVVGHAGLTYAADEGHVTTVAVDPAWQGRGVGARLLLVLFRCAVAGGATSLTLEVRASNAGAQHLYRRFGFVEAGIRAGYYTETDEDAVI